MTVFYLVSSHPWIYSAWFIRINQLQLKNNLDCSIKMQWFLLLLNLFYYILANKCHVSPLPPSYHQANTLSLLHLVALQSGLWFLFHTVCNHLFLFKYIKYNQTHIHSNLLCRQVAGRLFKGVLSLLRRRGGFFASGVVSYEGNGGSFIVVNQSQYLGTTGYFFIVLFNCFTIMVGWNRENWWTT